MITAPSYCKTCAAADLQRPADVAVIMPTVIRPDLNHPDRVRAIGAAYAAAGVPESAGIALH
jgi:hypothetical protein